MKKLSEEIAERLKAVDESERKQQTSTNDLLIEANKLLKELVNTTKKEETTRTSFLKGLIGISTLTWLAVTAKNMVESTLTTSQAAAGVGLTAPQLSAITFAGKQIGLGLQSVFSGLAQRLSLGQANTPESSGFYSFLNTLGIFNKIYKPEGAGFALKISQFQADSLILSRYAKMLQGPESSLARQTGQEFLGTALTTALLNRTTSPLLIQSQISQGLSSSLTAGEYSRGAILSQRLNQALRSINTAFKGLLLTLSPVFISAFAGAVKDLQDTLTPSRLDSLQKFSSKIGDWLYKFITQPAVQKEFSELPNQLESIGSAMLKFANGVNAVYDVFSPAPNLTGVASVNTVGGTLGNLTGGTTAMELLYLLTKNNSSKKPINITVMPNNTDSTRQVNFSLLPYLTSFF